MCSSMPCSNVTKIIKQACLFRGLSIQLLIVLIAGLDSRWFSLWLGSIITRPLGKVIQTLNFNLLSQDLFYFKQLQ